MRTNRRRSGARMTVALTLLAVMAGSYGLLVSRLWSATDTDLRVVNAERSGVAYLKPLTVLLGEIARAQTAAVHGQEADFPALADATVSVDHAETAHGAALGTAQRWADISQGIKRLASAKPAGKDALEQYTASTALVMALIQQIGDSSKLILDPELDSYYLMDTVLLRLPYVIATATATADEVALATDKEQPGMAVGLAAANYQLALTADAVGTGVRKAMDASRRTALGQNLTVALDEFHSSVDRWAPPATLRPQLPTVDPAGLTAATDKTRKAALALADIATAELDAVLAARADDLGADRILTLVSGGVGVLVLAVLLWWSAPAPRGQADDDGGKDGAQHDLGDIVLDAPSIEPLDLLAVEELAHSGRGVRVQARSQAQHDR